MVSCVFLLFFSHTFMLLSMGNHILVCFNIFSDFDQHIKPLSQEGALTVFKKRASCWGIHIAIAVQSCLSSQQCNTNGSFVATPRSILLWESSDILENLAMQWECSTVWQGLGTNTRAISSNHSNALNWVNRSLLLKLQ